MSLSYSIANAMTGLAATSRAAELVSNNVANAMTEGYARRDLELSARNFGGRGAGVTVDGVKRAVDEAVLRDRRLADASVGKTSVTAEYYAALERMIGTPEDYNSLTGRVDRLEQSLIEAASRPDNDARLQSVSDAAGALATHLNDVSDGLQRLRMDAEDGIAKHVDTLNASLKQIADLNTQIVSANQSKRDPSALMDLRQQEIDKVSSIISLRVVPRDNGRVAVFTTSRCASGRRPALGPVVRADAVHYGRKESSGRSSEWHRHRWQAGEHRELFGRGSRRAVRGEGPAGGRRPGSTGPRRARPDRALRG